LASGVVLLGYLWLLGFPAPAARATVMLVVDDVARLRQRVAAPRGVIAVSALAVLLVDPQALHSVGAWLSVTAIAAVVWAGRVRRRCRAVTSSWSPAGRRRPSGWPSRRRAGGCGMLRAVAGLSPHASPFS